MNSRAGARILRDRIVVVLFSLTLLTVFSILAFRRRHERLAEAPPKPVFVTTVSPEKADISRTLRFSAILEAESSITVLPRISGSITDLYVEEAMPVAPGDLLAKIDPEPFRLELKAAESAWLLAESSYERIERLHGGSGASRQQLDEAAAARDAAKSSYELARMQYEYSEVRAPVGGVVLSRFAERGSLAVQGQPLFVIGNDENLKVVVRVPEKHWPEFENPDGIRVAVGLPDTAEDQLVPATLLRLSPSISPSDRTFRVTCGVDRQDISWPLGSRLDAVFVLSETTDTWSLPLKAVGSDLALWKVDRDDSTAHRLEIPAGVRDSRRLEVPDAWSNDTFVLEGQHRLRENMVVRAVSGASGTN